MHMHISCFSLMQTPNGEGRGKKLKSLDELVASEHAAGKKRSYSVSRTQLRCHVSVFLRCAT